MTSTGLLDMLVADVLASSPAVAAVFMERHMACIGCTFAPFETVADAARAYGIDPDDLADAIASALHEHRKGTVRCRQKHQ